MKRTGREVDSRKVMQGTSKPPTGDQARQVDSRQKDHKLASTQHIHPGVGSSEPGPFKEVRKSHLGRVPVAKGKGCGRGQ